MPMKLDIPMILAQGLSPLERLNSMRPRTTSGNPKWVLSAIAWVLAVATLIVVGQIVYTYVQRRRTAKRFTAQSRKMGLSDSENKLLAHVAAQAGLRDINNVFTLDAAFDHGVATVMAGPRVAALSPHLREETIGLLNHLRDKLGFQKPAELPVLLNPISKGASLSIMQRKGAAQVQAVVSGARDAQFIVQAEPGVHAEPGETWLVRYTDGGSLWEFDATVLKQDDTRVILGHTGHMRFVNRRRFPRVPVSRPASVAAFPLLRSDGQHGAPTFVPATLVEIAGPGLQLDTTLTIQAAQRVLVLLQLEEGKAIEGLGNVHRVLPGANGLHRLCVELVGLSATDLAEMERQTNLAQVRTDPLQPAAAGAIA